MGFATKVRVSEFPLSVRMEKTSLKILFLSPFLFVCTLLQFGVYEFEIVSALSAAVLFPSQKEKSFAAKETIFKIAICMSEAANKQQGS